MAVIVQDVIDLMETIAPRWMACSGDRVGLHAGHPKTRVRKVLVVLDATLEAIREAKKRKCQMMIAHHPRFYRPLDTLDESNLMGQVAAELIRAKMALLCAHTNLDVAPGGINDRLADMAGLLERDALVPASSDALLKLAVYVPDSHLQAVRDAICDAGAGMIGEYGDCTFRTAGIGGFRGSSGTDPFIGTPGQYEEVEEWRLETILPESVRDAVVAALLQAHPYEEPAYELYVLRGGISYGLGRVGNLKKPSTLAALARKMKKSTRSPGTLVLGDKDKRVKRLVVWSGGGCDVKGVVRAKADAVVCGEIGYHDTEVLAAAGVGCIAVGHAPCEAIILSSLAESLHEGLDGVEVDVFDGGTPIMWSV